MASTAYDAIIVGAGHNGLVTACYLARAGWRVLVLERRSVVGGTCVTEEPFDGFKVSTAAYVVSLFRPEIVRDLRLRSYGYEVLPRNPSSFTPLEDGRSLLLGPDRDRNRREIAKFSVSDAAAYDGYEAYLTEVGALLEEWLLRVPPDPSRLSWRTMSSLAAGARSFGQLRDKLGELTRILTVPATDLLDEWFESDVLRATLATDAIIGAMASPSVPGTAYVLLHHVMGETNGVRGVWGYVRGGMGGLTAALASAGRDLGVEILCEAQAARIETRDGRVTGVTLADGRSFESSTVISCADAHVTFEKLIGVESLPEDFVKAIRRIDYSSASVKVNVALSEVPNFLCTENDGVGPEHHGTIHISPSMEYIEAAYDDARRGRPSARPVLECTIPSVVDDTLAPPGSHVMSMFVQYGPYELAQGNWDEIKEEFGDRCIAELARYAPNIENAVIDRQVISPLDLERTFGMTGGNIFQGAMTPSQMFWSRPVYGHSQYATPIEGLYLCGAATHPGGGVMGACGYNAARVILS